LRGENDVPKALMFAGSCNGALPYVRNPKGVGISAFRVDLGTGAAEHLADETDVLNPTFVAMSADGRSLLASSELAGAAEGMLSAYAVDPASGRLGLLSRVGTRGATPAHVSFDHSGRYAASVNYGDVALPASAGASVVVYRRGPGGEIEAVTSQATISGHGPDAARQDRPHAHCVRWTPDNRFVVVADLGVDRLVVFRFDATAGSLTKHGEAELAPGAGPRHFVFDAGGAHAYVANELNSTLTSFAVDPETARFTPLAAEPTVPAGFSGTNYPAAIQLAPDGKHVFVANRFHDSIARFAIDSGGAARLVDEIPSGGSVPRDFAFDPSGRILAVANQESDRISLFRYAGDRLIPFGRPFFCGSPTAIAFHPALQ
jgi:6-phosphogluconolactonase